MFSEGTVWYFTPYFFTRGKGQPSKNRYLIVIKDAGNDLIIISLPTSKDHIPLKYEHLYGCINDDTANINCYRFKKNDPVSECNTKSFLKDTYVYGANIEIIDRKKLMEKYPDSDKDYREIFSLRKDVLDSLKLCLKKSKSVKRGIKRII
jgi:hypothetical protein